MNPSEIIRTIRKSYANYRGWTTNKKLLLFESDDWGSVRIRDKKAYRDLIRKGLPLDKSRYTMFDSLESETDLYPLFNILNKYRDCRGNKPIFSANFLTANPDFNKIAKNDFEEYHFLDLRSSYEQFSSGGDKMLSILSQGISEKLMTPQFHGREHLHPTRWLNCLLASSKERIAFNYSSVPGIKFSSNEQEYVTYLSAFDYSNDEERNITYETLKSGLSLFKDTFGFSACSFIPSQSVMGDDLFPILRAEGIQLCKAGARIPPKQINPNKSMKHNYWGRNSEYNILLSRSNCNFEPSKSSKNWIDNCLADIHLAFKFGKPAVISTHRVNYIGSLNEKNQMRSLQQLDKLLYELIKRYPDIEFIDSPTLVQHMKNL